MRKYMREVGIKAKKYFSICPRASSDGYIHIKLQG
jgi:hypothetical protein